MKTQYDLEDGLRDAGSDRLPATEQFRAWKRPRTASAYPGGAVLTAYILVPELLANACGLVGIDASMVSCERHQVSGSPAVENAIAARAVCPPEGSDVPGALHLVSAGRRNRACGYLPHARSRRSP